MGRELKRREAKQNKTKIEKEEELEFEINKMTILKVASTIILILLASYYVLAVFVTKEIDISEKDTEATTTENTNTENKILAANIFNQSEEKYYIYCYDFNSEEEGLQNAINGSDKTIYRLNTSDGLNSKYVTEDTGNPNATSLEDLKVTNPTLIEISGDKITGYYEGKNQILSFLSK